MIKNGLHIKADGTKEWYLHGDLHRIGSPAVVYSEGSEEWRQYGKLHRDDGPAFSQRGHLSWWYRGERHRVDGPAVIHEDGTLEWWVGYNSAHSAREFQNLTRCSDEHLIKMVLIYGEIK